MKIKIFTICSFFIISNLFGITFYLNDGETFTGVVISVDGNILFIESDKKLIKISSDKIKSAFDYGEDVLNTILITTGKIEVNESNYEQIESNISENIIVPQEVEKITNNEITFEQQQESVLFKDSYKIAPTIEQKNFPKLLEENEFLNSVFIIKRDGQYLSGNIKNGNSEGMILENSDGIRILILTADIEHIFFEKHDLKYKISKILNNSTSQFNIREEKSISYSQAKDAGFRAGKKDSTIFLPVIVGGISGALPIVGPILTTAIAFILPANSDVVIPEQFQKNTYKKGYVRGRKTTRAMYTFIGGALSTLIYINSI